MEFIRSQKQSLSLDMAPLIDVVFQLLIFFMLSSSFIAPAINLNLPRDVIKDDRKIERTLVTIDKDGNFYVNKKAVTGGNLTAMIEDALFVAKKKSVDLRGDGEIPYRYFVEALDAARRAGATQVNIVHQGEGRK